MPAKRAAVSSAIPVKMEAPPNSRTYKEKGTKKVPFSCDLMARCHAGLCINA